MLWCIIQVAFRSESRFSGCPECSPWRAPSPLLGLSLLERERERERIHPRLHTLAKDFSRDSLMWGEKAHPPHSNLPASASNEIALQLFFSLWPVLQLSLPIHSDDPKSTS